MFGADLYCCLSELRSHLFVAEGQRDTGEMQEVTGTVSVWGRQNDYYDIEGPRTIQFRSPSLDFNINVLYTPVQVPGSITPVISGIPFVGIDRPFGP